MNLISLLPGKLRSLPQRPANGLRSGGKPLPTKARRSRFLYVLGFFILWAMAITLRLFWLQVVMRQRYVDKAARQQQQSFEIAPRRGMLYDRNLVEMASSVLADSVFVVPYEVLSAKDENRVYPDKMAAAKLLVAQKLAQVVHTDPTDTFTSAERINARMNASRDYAWVARGLDPAVIAKVKALNLPCVHIVQEYKRFYPGPIAAAQVLGYVGTDAAGLGGIEQQFEDDLHGTPGHLKQAFDAKRQATGSTENESIPGENLVLTIDANIQFLAEKALDRNMERTHAENGTVVVQDPHTGQILALAVRPTYNPNDFRHANKELLRDRAVSDVYEPGSTFKPVTYAAALEEKAITPDSIVDCGGGSINIAGHTVHDAPGDHFGQVPAWKALAVSSNVCAIRVGQKVGPEVLYKYIRAFGFGDRSGIELPAETRGLLEPLKHWGPASMGAIPMGQEVAVTPIQIVTMVSSIANGGTYLPPRLLLASTDEVKGSAKLQPAAFHPGYNVPNPLPEGGHRVISEMTAAQLRKMMEDVVLIGTARGAVHLNGYSAAGKTGTAEKIDPRTRTYSKTKFVASFVGFAPVNNPAITLAIVMDSPDHSMHFGAQASAPVFQELAQEILEYLGVPHDTELRTTPEIAKELASAGPEEHEAEADAHVEQLFDQVNDLPADDPLHSTKQPTGDASAVTSGDANGAAVPMKMPSEMPVAFSPSGKGPTGADSAPAQSAQGTAESARPATVETAQTVSSGDVVVDSSQRVPVPSFLGHPLRRVIEEAGTTGLTVKVEGNGLAREQVPAAGTMVPAGTAILVRFIR